MNNISFKHLPHDICRVTSKFGYRINPITLIKDSFHQGIDIGAIKSGVQGDKLYTVDDGKVVYAGYMPSTVYGYGYFIIIEHDGYCTLYAHMTDLIVKVNQYVKAGDIIGYMGSTGASTAPHLHFEVQPIKWTGYSDYIEKADGIRKHAVDPYQFIEAYNKRLEVNEDMANEIVRYKNIGEMPIYYQALVKELVDKGVIKGNSTGDLNMTEDMVRTLIVAGRMIDKNIKFK